MNLAQEDEIRLLCLVGPLFFLVPWRRFGSHTQTNLQLVGALPTVRLNRITDL